MLGPAPFGHATGGADQVPGVEPSDRGLAQTLDPGVPEQTACPGLLLQTSVHSVPLVKPRMSTLLRRRIARPVVQGFSTSS